MISRREKPRKSHEIATEETEETKETERWATKERQDMLKKVGRSMTSSSPSIRESATPPQKLAACLRRGDREIRAQKAK
jgi:hypothetical protein